MPEIERAQPLLGTRVSVRVEGLSPAHAHRAIDLAFAEVTQVQRLMSFHDPASDLSRINREAAFHPVSVHRQTWRVLARALRVAQASGGRFDPCVAPRLVALGVLPRPHAAPRPDVAADWRDVEMLADHRVHLRRPLWLDLGGIAKGYAVDRALARLRACGAICACVDAGGDLRLYGPREQAVALRAPHSNPATLPVVMLRDAALASSATDVTEVGAELSGRPLDGRGTRVLPRGWLATVVAPQAWLADALTKVVLSDPLADQSFLKRCGAQVYMQSPAGSWQQSAA